MASSGPFAESIPRRLVPEHKDRSGQRCPIHASPLRSCQSIQRKPSGLRALWRRITTRKFVLWIKPRDRGRDEPHFLTGVLLVSRPALWSPEATIYRPESRPEALSILMTSRRLALPNACHKFQSWEATAPCQLHTLVRRPLCALFGRRARSVLRQRIGHGRKPSSITPPPPATTVHAQATMRANLAPHFPRRRQRIVLSRLGP
jgi:hypothetical protein